MNSKISIALCLLFLATPTAAQKTKVKKMAWPKITKRDQKRVQFQLRQLAAKDPDGAEADYAKVEAAEAALASMGAGITLSLLRRLPDKDIVKREAIQRVLDRVLTQEHSPLLARLVRRKEPEVRQYAIARLARFHLPKMAAVFTEALEDRDEDVVFFAALGLGGLENLEAMRIVFDRCRTDWRQHRDIVSEILEKARGEKAADWVLAQIHTQDVSGWVSGLRLLRSLAPKSYKEKLQASLNAEQSSVKKAAINALRVVIDGDTPLEKLSVFQAIELAEKWRNR